MSTQIKTHPRRSLSVSTKISLGFTIVLALHVSIAVLGHYGLSKGARDLEVYDSLHHQVENFGAIDRVVSELQRNVLLFAFTGFQGPELRAAQLHDDLDDLLRQADEHHLNDADLAAIKEMSTHLAAHREIFEAVVVDRANRRRLVNEVLTQHGRDFDESVQTISDDRSTADEATAIVSEFRAAEYSTMQFVNAPDSLHVRHAKSHLAKAKTQLNRLASDIETNADDSIQPAIEAVNSYEDSLIQMVQATRGYLHLVNVVLAG
jgi:hypothetical protein